MQLLLQASHLRFQITSHRTNFPICPGIGRFVRVSWKQGLGYFSRVLGRRRATAIQSKEKMRGPNPGLSASRHSENAGRQTLINRKSLPRRWDPGCKLACLPLRGVDSHSAAHELEMTLWNRSDSTAFWRLSEIRLNPSEHLYLYYKSHFFFDFSLFMSSVSWKGHASATPHRRKPDPGGATHGRWRWVMSLQSAWTHPAARVYALTR